MNVGNAVPGMAVPGSMVPGTTAPDFTPPPEPDNSSDSNLFLMTGSL